MLSRDRRFLRLTLILLFLFTSVLLSILALNLVSLLINQYHSQLLANTTFLIYICLIFISAYGFTRIERQLSEYRLPLLVKKAPKVKRKLTYDTLVMRVGAAISKIPFISWIADVLAEPIFNELKFAYIFQYPIYFTAFWIAVFLICFALTTSLSLALFTLYKNPLFFLIPLSSLPILSLPFIEVKLRISNRKSNLDTELPFFVTYASILQSAGLSLYNAFKRVINRGILPSMERESLLVDREYKFFTHNPLTAMENVARDHPNQDFQTLVMGYTSLLRSGGDVNIYLEAKVKDFLEYLKRKWERYSEGVGSLGELLIIVFTIIPTIILSSSIAFTTRLSGTLMIIYTFFLLPLITVGISISIHTIQPKFRDEYNLTSPILYGIIAAAISLLPIYAFVRESYLILALALLIFSIPIGLGYYVQYYEVSKVESALPQFLRDLTELKKIGYDITQAIIYLSRKRSYNKSFDRILKFTSKQIQLNMPFKMIVDQLRARSWLLKYTLFALSEMTETGGGSPRVLESLTDFINGVYYSKRNMKSNTRIYAILAYMTPVLLMFIIVMFRQLIVGFTTQYVPALPANMPITPTQAQIEQILNLSLINFVLTSFFLGVLVAKMSDLSFLGFRHVILTMSIALASLMLIQFQIPIIPGLLGNLT